MNYPDDAAVSASGTVQWQTRVYAASSRLDLWGLTTGAAKQEFLVDGAVGEQPLIKLSILAGNAGPLDLPCKWHSADTGRSFVHLPRDSNE